MLHENRKDQISLPASTSPNIWSEYSVSAHLTLHGLYCFETITAPDKGFSIKKYCCFFFIFLHDFVCVEILRPSQPNGVMSSAVSLPNHTLTGQA